MTPEPTRPIQYATPDHERALRDLGFDVLILWECDTRNDAKLQQVVAAFFCSADGMRAEAPTSGQIRTINQAARH
jgi:G:T-mismatch repair DNA endonuclease (very short patch repair protein)